MELAGQIAKKSPVAMVGTKHNLNFSRDHSAQEGLEYMVKHTVKATIIVFSTHKRFILQSEHNQFVQFHDENG